MARRFARGSLTALLFGMIIQGCALNSQDPSQFNSQRVARTVEAAASLSAILELTPVAPPFSTPLIITPMPSPIPSVAPTSIPLHILRPGDAPLVGNSLSDISSAPFAQEKRTLGDHFDLNLYERPMTSIDMEYKAFLDITPGAALRITDPWVYVTIFLAGAPIGNAEAYYGIELDLNLDSRGDWLILASTPATTEWSAEGLRAYLDSNGDVGGQTPMRADPHPGDGYDSLIFDDKTRFDPDIAWVRRSPINPSVIQIAFKHFLIRNDKTFTWSAWSFTGEIKPDWFDLNDHFSGEEAGSPIPSSRFYPLNGLHLVDNTCRWREGILPRPGMPGICAGGEPEPSTTPSPEPSPTP
jgi:hypothetical protein